MLLRAIMGSENWSGHSAKFHVFHAPSGAQEIHIGTASRDPTSPITAVPGAIKFPAKRGYRPEFGEWTDTTFNIPPGSIVKIFGNKAGSFGQMQLSAHVFFQLREEGALMNIKMRLSSDPAATFSVAFVQTRGDILTFDEARLAGVRVLPQFRSFAEPAMVNRLFEFETVEPEVRARAVLEERIIPTSEGESVSVTVRRRGRAMQF